MLIWHSPFFLQLMLSRHSGHCFRLDLSHHCSLSDKEYFPRIIVWNFVNTSVHVHLGISDSFKPQGRQRFESRVFKSLAILDLDRAISPI